VRNNGSRFRECDNLEALPEHCEVMQAGMPELLANRGFYGFASLPFELRSRA